MKNFPQKIIEWAFYLLFFLVPLWFFAGNSELFEYNKMMLTYGLTIIITAAWLIKSLIIKNSSLEKESSFLNQIVRRTPLDIPIALYLLSHTLSTIFSLDPHISLWGYYSRFHEGLLATVSYIFLYYAAVSNLHRNHVINILKVSFVSAAIVSTYGALEHFGHSPSCLFITGNFNVDCWVQDVKNRVFATLGQPNWMAAYLDAIILIFIGFFFHKERKTQSTGGSDKSDYQTFRLSDFLTYPSFLKIGAIILYLFALYATKSRSGLVGLAAGTGIFILFSLKIPERLKIAVCVLGLIIAGFIGWRWFQSLPITSTGISESGVIRKPVWEGAIKVWQRYPVFGSGVETFAYAYYQDRPASHNLLSEWDFLYNKAHNEFLNILATTGTVGFLSYSSILGLFAIWFVKNNLVTRGAQITTNYYLITALFAAWISILVTNFFGFSVVIIGLYFFLIPAFCFLLHQENEPKNPPAAAAFSFSQIGLIGLIILIGLVMEINLLSMWTADKDYGYGKNLDSVQHYVEAYPYLKRAVDQNPSEPTFRDELSSNESVLAAAIFQQASGSAQEKLAASLPQYNLTTQNFLDRAVADSNQVVDTSPNAMPFWKTRTRVFYQLGTIDGKYYLDALAAIQKAAQLAPTDAKVHYNLGILLARTNQVPAAIKAFEETVAMKPDYRDAYYALALYYDQAGDKVKAKQTMQLILSKIGPDPEAQKWLEEHK